MKTLVNCNPREFFIQTNKIRKAVESWLNMTKVVEIGRRTPKIDDNMSEQEQTLAYENQAKKNIQDIFDAIFEDHPNESADILGLLCFVEPEDIVNHSMSEFYGAIAEILGSREVLDFFISLMRLANTNISISAKA